MYLVDTNVFSASSPVAGGVEWSDLLDWMEANSARLFLSTVSVAEVSSGIAKARRTGAARKAERLAEWLGTVLHLYRGRILPLDLNAARATGEVSDHARAAGHDPGFADLAIAGTARSRGLTVLTRNLRHFGPLGIAALNPYLELPA